MSNATTTPDGAAEMNEALQRAARFKRVAARRANAALAAIERLHNTARRESYSYSESQVDEIVGKLREAIDRLEAAYRQQTQPLRVEL